MQCFELRLCGLELGDLRHCITEAVVGQSLFSPACRIQLQALAATYVIRSDLKFMFSSHFIALLSVTMINE